METNEIMQKLKQVRINSKISQEELAEKVGVTRQTIRNWENGDYIPNVTELIKLCNVLKIKITIREKKQ